MMENGIIPARAGFTNPFHITLEGRTDHPRSRGVYGPATVSKLIQVGSSPLARGLPGPEVVGLKQGRIIPARAGFTRCTIRLHYLSPDHPRSRGVYARPGAADLIGWGIIPARAGFTHLHP